MEKSSVAKFPKLLIMLRMYTTHGFDHLLTEFHGRRQWFWVTSENITKVDVEQLARFGQHQIVQMSITNSQQIGYDTITG